MTPPPLEPRLNRTTHTTLAASTTAQSPRPSPRPQVESRQALKACAHSTASGEPSQTAKGEPPQLPVTPPLAPDKPVLVVFSGKPRDHNLATALRALGLRAIEIDTHIAGRTHDLTRECVLTWLENQLESGALAGAFIATPCSSYSIAHKPLRRTLADPYGNVSLGKEWALYMYKHNLLAVATARLATAAAKGGGFAIVENPARRNDPLSPACWRNGDGSLAYPDHCSLFDMPVIRALAQHVRAITLTFPMCHFSGPSGFQKWTSLLATPCMIAHMRPFMHLSCNHASHGQVAHGFDSSGRSATERAGEYPPEMEAALARAIAARAQQGSKPPQPDASHERGGRVAEGPRLHPVIARACDLRSTQPPPFASLRNRAHEHDEALLREPLPWSLFAAAAEHPSRHSRPKKQRGRPLPPTIELPRSLPPSGKPSGDIAIWQLFHEGIYEGIIMAWLRQAQQAFADIRAGKQPRQVPTQVLPQEAMPEWAQGQVWCTSNHLRCAPVARSTAQTTFPGARQLNRPAFRQMAADVGSADLDIVSQVCEGGVEPRSSCDLTTVLAFHHKGAAQNFPAVNAAIASDMANEWVSPPLPHPPYIPVRVVPRSVVLQERPRLKDGRLETYLKPRVTTDLSDGGMDSVNAGVPMDGRYVQLPAARHLGRAAAVIDAMSRLQPDGSFKPRGTGTDADGRAALYAVDAQSAYRFIPVQHADLWAGQIFIWDTCEHWEARPSSGGVEPQGTLPHGPKEAGFCTDRRLSFGGAYSVQRFERITTIVGAYAQLLQAAFDAANPLPPGLARSTDVRRQLMQTGLLPGAPGQESPRFLMVYSTRAGLECASPPIATSGQPLTKREPSLDRQSTIGMGAPHPIQYRSKRPRRQPPG